MSPRTETNEKKVSIGRMNPHSAPRKKMTDMM
jgi:hypothetical protein